MSDLAQQIRAEQKRLYATPNLTDELPDDEAQELLEWASAQIPNVIKNGSQIEEQSKKFRRLLSYINYFVGNSEGMGEDELMEELAPIYQSASDLNYPVQSDLMTPLIAELVGQNMGDVLIILLAWLENDSLLVEALS